MSSQPLPTKGKFLDDLEIIENCDICHDPFDDTHKVTRTKCHHIFGLTCLTAWINSNAEQSNTCPMCRQPLFTKTKAPVFAEGLNPDCPWYFSLAVVNDERTARIVVRFMWRAMRGLLGRDVTYDSDIEAQIFKVGYLLQEFSLNIYCIAPEHLLNLRIVGKDMIREQIDKAQSGTLEAEDSPLDAEVWSRWLPPVAEAFGWQLEETAAQLPEPIAQLPEPPVQPPEPAVQLPEPATQLPGPAVQSPEQSAWRFLWPLLVVVIYLCIISQCPKDDGHEVNESGSPFQSKSNKRGGTGRASIRQSHHPRSGLRTNR